MVDESSKYTAYRCIGDEYDENVEANRKISAKANRKIGIPWNICTCNLFNLKLKAY